MKCVQEKLKLQDVILLVLTKCQQIKKLWMDINAHTFTNLTCSFQEGILIVFNELHLISWK